MNVSPEENKKETKSRRWTVVLVFPLIWGLFGLIQGKGFFPYILENIWALIILALIFGAFLFVLVFFIDK